ncbi:uncharacterized protein [Onthophagus taurus]|uniref:uncharacterized protein isoform X2 n=1 Tax=Onthophagus taurus TaxID=166361 RepID=UPI0039BE10CF
MTTGMMMVKTYLYFSLLITVIGLCTPLSITELRVPTIANHEAPLDCKYKLENMQLYDVKWYKDGDQFFRCLPNGEVYEYPVDGLKIYYTKFAPIGSCPVTLTALNTKSTGEYKCEVSAEAPNFNVATKSAKLKFVPYVLKKEMKVRRVHSTLAPEQREKNSTWHALSSKGNSSTISHRLSWNLYLLFIIISCISIL